MILAIGILLSLTIGGILYFVLDSSGGKTAAERKLLHERMDKLVTKPKINLEKSSQFSSIKKINETLVQQKFAREISYLLQMSGWKINPSAYLLLSLIFSVSVYNILKSTGLAPLYNFMLSTLSFYFIPISILKAKRAVYIKKFLNHFPKSLAVIRGALTAGLGLSTAIEHCARDSPYPVNTEFGIILKQMNLGKSLVDGLSELRYRIPDKDVNTFCTAIEVQQDAGGNLAEVMKNIEETINARIMIRKEMKALTGQAVMTGWIICLLPVGIGLILSSLNPQYMSLLFSTETGRKIVTGTAIFYFIGVMVIKKLISIKLLT